MPAGCNCGPNSPLARTLGCHCVRRCTKSLPVSCHFRGCKVPLFRTVSGAISSELALPLPLLNTPGIVETETSLSCVGRWHLEIRVSQFIWQWVSSCCRSHGKSTTTIRVQLEPWGNEQVAAGWMEMLSFSDLSDRHAQLRQVVGRLAMKTLVYHPAELVACTCYGAI